MQVIVHKQEGYKPRVVIQLSTSGEVAYEPETIEEWIRMLRVAASWLRKNKKVPAK